MAAANMECSEWIVAAKKKKSDKKKRLSDKKNASIDSENSARVVLHAVITTTTNHHDEVHLLDLHNALLECQQHWMETDLYQNLLQTFDTWLQQGLQHITSSSSSSARARLQLVCYGVGNFASTSFSYYSASLGQLATALNLQAHAQQQLDIHHPPDPQEGDLPSRTPVVELIFYDPCSTRWEVDFLTTHLSTQTHPIRVLSDNQQGRYDWYQDPAGNEVVTSSLWFFFLPHCPRRLYDHLLWAHWCHLIQRPWAIVGNSLHRMTDPTTGWPDTSSVTSSTYPCLQTILPWIQEEPLMLSPRDLDQVRGNLVGAFNDTYFIQMARPSLLPVELWPERPEMSPQESPDPELL